jgi:serine protease inhibitor
LTVLFRGKWKFAFNPSETCHGVWNWNSADGAKPRVQYMNRHFEDEREHLYAGIVGGSGEARVVRVPYTAPGIEAWFILPVASGASALAAVGNALPQLWHQINAMSRLGRHRRPVYLTCPRFDISTSIENVVPALWRVGVEAAFEPKGGFLNATDSRLTCITGIVQRVICAVDEAGTVAAACTAICCEDGDASDDEDTFTMVLDRPFWMAIAVKQHPEAASSMPLLIGRVMQPNMV